jgi:hypothetical protein
MPDKKEPPSKHEVIRDEKGQFVKGSSGNPGGRPSKTLTALLKDRINEGKSCNKADLIINKAIELAIEGDIQAIKWIFERVDGRPIPMRIDLIEEHKPIRILDIGFSETLEEIADDEVIVIEKDGTERIEKKKEYATFVVE